MAEKEKRRATTFRTSKGTIVNVQYPDIYVSPAFLSTEDVTNPTELREALREELIGANLTVKLTQAGFFAYGLTIEGDYLYATLQNYDNQNTVNGKLAKISKKDLSTVAVLDLPYPRPSDVRSDGTNLYVSYASVTGVFITKINIGTFIITSNLAIPTNASWIAIDLPGTYLYAVTFFNPGQIFKIDLATFTLVATLTLNLGESNGHGLSLDWEYLYVCLGITPAVVVRVALATFTRVDAITFAADESECLDVLPLAGVGGSTYDRDDYLYAIATMNPVHVVRIRRVDFAIQDSLQLNVNGDAYKASCDGEFIYIGINSLYRANIAIIRLADFSLVSVIRLDYPPSVRCKFVLWGSRGGFTCRPATDGNFIYAASMTDPSILYKIRIQRTFEQRVTVFCRLWLNQTIPVGGTTTKAIPGHYPDITFWIYSDQAGTLNLQGFDEYSETFRTFATTAIAATTLTPYKPNVQIKSIKANFVPSVQASVNLWAVIQ